MNLGWKVVLAIGGGLALFQFLFQDSDLAFKIQLVTILAVVILALYVEDTRKKLKLNESDKDED